MYEATTANIRVIVRPEFLENQSDPANGKFVWAYTIAVENHGVEAVTLLTRHWIITDALGYRQDVRGDGVVGEQPTLKPGESFEYTSGCPLATPSGMMVGSYGMVTAEGRALDIAIPAFSLDSPHDRRSLN
jgi:ApaG protein